MSDSAGTPTPAPSADRGSGRRWGSTAVAGGYVALVTALAAHAWSRQPADFSGSEAAAMILTLPALVVGLPVIYVVGAAIWNLTGADAGGPMWPVTVVYSAMFAAVAVVNVVLLHQLRRYRRERAAARGTDPAP